MSSALIETVVSNHGIEEKERRVLALRFAGWKQSELAADLGVHHTAVYRVLHGKTKSYKIASRLADITGVSLSRLYPDGRYEMNKEQAA